LLESQASNCTQAEALALPGLPSPAVLLNAYYLQEEASRALRRGDAESAFVEEVFAKAAAMGVSAVRTWAFNDDPAKAGDSAMQTAKLVYDETALRGLDLVLARAAHHGVKLVLPLGNYWNDYGGARQYAAWAGLQDPVEGDPRFFTDSEVRAHYREHVRRLLQRVNSIDGHATFEHPAVLAWELLNEPRGRGLDAPGAQLRAWVDEMAAHVKALAPGHLVGTGEEGFEPAPPAGEEAFWRDAAPSWFFAEGASFRLNTASPHVDFAGAHLFPESWAWSRDRVAAAGARWIAFHAAAAREAGKPFLLGEFALRNAGAFSLEERRAIYRGWFACARAAGAGGAAPWMFAYDARPDEWDLHTFYFRDATFPGDAVNRYADLVIAAARP
jgi:mannan endo-1,4-beta-mannosidase